MISQNNENRKTCVVVMPAAGSSSRMKEFGNKLFLNINNTPIIAITLKALNDCPLIDAIIIPTRPDMIDEIKSICSKNNFNKVIAVIPGGKTRADSVMNGIISANGKFDLIAIHDAARPFVSQRIIEETIKCATNKNAAAPAVPVKDTIKKAENGVIEKTVPRETLFAIQTPQIFDCELITSALTKAIENNIPITDDCSAVELFGEKVHLITGDYFNIKVTTPEDIFFAEAILKSKEGETNT